MSYVKSKRSLGPTELSYLIMQKIKNGTGKQSDCSGCVSCSGKRNLSSMSIQEMEEIISKKIN